MRRAGRHILELRGDAIGLSAQCRGRNLLPLSGTSTARCQRLYQLLVCQWVPVECQGV